MSSSRTVKKRKRYRYCLSQAYLQKKKELAGSLPQVPANELEGSCVRPYKKKTLRVTKGVENCSIEKHQLYKQNLENFLEFWSLQNKETYFIIRQIIHKVVISVEKIVYYLNLKSLQKLFGLIITKQEISNFEAKEITDNDCEILILPCELKRVNQGKTLIIGKQDIRKNDGIIKLLKQAWKWSDNIENNMTIKEIAEQEKVSISYISKMLKLRFLSPKIQKMILLGEQAEKLTSHNLRNAKSDNFEEQERELGIL